MDADVMITVAFCFEAFLFALAGGVFIVHEARRERAEAAAEKGRVRVEPTEVRTQPRTPASTVPCVTARTRRAVRGVRS
jgi:hypothetical protein